MLQSIREKQKKFILEYEKMYIFVKTGGHIKRERKTESA